LRRLIPKFTARITWQETNINAIFGEVRNLQGKVSSQMNMLDFATKEESSRKYID
jgi:hypothetical protein